MNMSHPIHVEKKSEILKIKKVGRKLYLTEHIEQFRKDHPDIQGHAATTALCHQWKELSEIQKESYDMRALVSNVLKDIDVDITAEKE